MREAKGIPNGTVHRITWRTCSKADSKSAVLGPFEPLHFYQAPVTVMSHGPHFEKRGPQTAGNQGRENRRRRKGKRTLCDTIQLWVTRVGCESVLYLE